MGTASSRTLLNDSPAFAKFTPEQLSTFVSNLGPEFDIYSKEILTQGIDGAKILTWTETEVMSACRVVDPNHVTTMLYHLKQHKPPLVQQASTSSLSARKSAKPKRKSLGRENAITMAADAVRAEVQQAVLASIEASTEANVQIVTASVSTAVVEQTLVTPIEMIKQESTKLMVSMPITKAPLPAITTCKKAEQEDGNVIQSEQSSPDNSAKSGEQAQKTGGVQRNPSQRRIKRRISIGHTVDGKEMVEASIAQTQQHILNDLEAAFQSTTASIQKPPLPEKDGNVVLIQTTPIEKEPEMLPARNAAIENAVVAMADHKDFGRKNGLKNSTSLSDLKIQSNPENLQSSTAATAQTNTLSDDGSPKHGLRPVMSLHTMARDHYSELARGGFDPYLSHYHAYFSYAVGKDSTCRVIRERIARVNKLLLDNHIVVWYDSDKSATENALIQQGLAHSSVVIVFVTRHYMNLVNSDGQLESCQYEFSLALYTKTVDRMIFIVLEDEMKRYDCLSGEFRIIIGEQECMDFTHDEDYEEACQELAEKILEMDRLLPRPVEAGIIEGMGVSTLMALLKQEHQTWEVCERVLKRLIVLATASSVYADKMLSKGILPILVHFVKLDPSDEELPREAELAILLLKILARSSGVLRRKILLAIQDMSLLTSFTAYLTIGEGFTKEHTAGLIRNLFVVGGIKAFDKSDGFRQTIAALLKMLSSGTMLQQYEAGAALCAISLNREYQSLLVEESAIAICMRKLTSATTHETVRDKAAQVLRYLSGTEDNQREIGSEGGIVAFLTLLKSGTHSQRDTSAAALNWLMECSDNRSRLVKENGILTLLNYVVRGRKFVRQQTLSALSKLAPHAEYQIPLAKAGLLGPCVAILGVGNDSQKTAACIILTALASTDLLHMMKDAISPVVNLYCEGTVPQKKAAKLVLEKLSHHKPFKEQIISLVKEESLMLH